MPVDQQRRLALVATLASVYGLEISMARARDLAISIAKAAGWVLVGEAVASYGASLLKGISFGAALPLVAAPQAAAAVRAMPASSPRPTRRRVLLSPAKRAKSDGSGFA